jgi:hypothetical protein
LFNECRHIRPSGIKCKSPALRTKPYCYYHLTLHGVRNPSATDDKQPIILPSLEDFSGIQIALHHVLGALSSSRIDPRRAGLYLRGLRIAAELVAKSVSDSPEESVRDLSYEDNGDSLAPEETACEPPQDCLKCKQREQCEDFEDYEDEVEELEQCEEEEEVDEEEEEMENKES